MGRRRDEESKSLRFKERDVVLAKVAGSPLWPSVIRQCEVDKSDPNYEFNGMFYRNPDWYWCSFFGSDGEDDEGMWVRSSKIRNFTYKGMPQVPDNDALAAAHESADKFYTKNHSDGDYADADGNNDDDDKSNDADSDEEDEADDEEPKKTPNGVKSSSKGDDEDEDDGEKTVGSGGAGKSPHNPDPGATTKSLDEEIANVTGSATPTRRSQRPRAQKGPAHIAKQEQPRPATRGTQPAKRGRTGNSGVAQKRPRRSSIGNAAFKKPGDMNMSLDETRAQLWAARRTIHEQNQIIKSIQSALSNWRST